MQNLHNRELQRIIGQKTEDVTIIIENHQKTAGAFEFMRAGNNRKYNKSKGKPKRK